MRFQPGRCLLRQHLQDRKQTQRWLAEVTGISEQKISDYSNKRSIMRLDNAKTIASVLRIPVDDLYEWEVDKSR